MPRITSTCRRFISPGRVGSAPARSRRPSVEDGQEYRPLTARVDLIPAIQYVGSDGVGAPQALAGSGMIRIMTVLPARLSIVTLGARDMSTLRQFYRRFGWPELPDGDDTWTGFLLGGVLLALFPQRDLTAEAAPDSPAPT